MQLHEIRIKIIPTRFVTIEHFGKKKSVLRGGDYVQMEPGEEPKGPWIHYERREIKPGETHAVIHPHGAVGPHQHYPPGQKYRIAAFLHHEDGNVYEHHHYGLNGVPMERHPLEDPLPEGPEAHVEESQPQKEVILQSEVVAPTVEDYQLGKMAYDAAVAQALHTNPSAAIPKFDDLGSAMIQNWVAAAKAVRGK